MKNHYLIQELCEILGISINKLLSGKELEIKDFSKEAFGNYLYEISGSNINKVFSGFYASAGRNYIILYDLSVKYEITDNISKKQLLAISALLFGRY